MSRNFVQKTNINNSGQGAQSVVPDEVAKKFNWGAFLASWIWCLYYGQYVLAIVFLLIAFVPLLGAIGTLCFAIFFGIKGNTWAWQSRHYKSIEEFHKIQTKWVWGALAFIAASLLSGLLFFVLAAVLHSV